MKIGKVEWNDGRLLVTDDSGHVLYQGAARMTEHTIAGDGAEADGARFEFAFIMPLYRPPEPI